MGYSADLCFTMREHVTRPGGFFSDMHKICYQVSLGKEDLKKRACMEPPILCQCWFCLAQRRKFCWDFEQDQGGRLFRIRQKSLSWRRVLICWNVCWVQQVDLGRQVMIQI